MSNYIYPDQFTGDPQDALDQIEEAIERADDDLQVRLFGDTLENIWKEPGIKGVIDRYNLLAGLANIISMNGGINMGLSVAQISPSTELDPITSTDPIVIPGLTAPMIVVQETALYQSTGNTGLQAPARPATLLTVPLQKLVTLVAPTMGFSLDSSFFTTQEWFNLRDALVQYCWDGTEVSPVLWDAANQAYADARIYETLRGLSNINPGGWITNSFSPSVEFQNAIIGGVKILNVESGKQYYLDGSRAEEPGYYNVVEEYAPSTDAAFVTFPYRNYGVETTVEYYQILVSSSPFTAEVNIYRTISENPDFNLYKTWGLYYTDTESSQSYTLNGQTVYYILVSSIGKNEFVSASDDLLDSYSGRYTFQGREGLRTEYIAWNYLYNYNPANNIVGYYSWRGDLVDYTTNAIEAIQSATSDSVITRPFYPVHIVIGDPDVTYSPLTDPNPKAPTTAPNTVPYISPQIQPEYFPQTAPVPSQPERTAPLPTIVPYQNPVIAPTNDPYEEPSPEELIEIKDYEQDIVVQPPTETTSPPSSGESPSIQLPDGSTWPGIIPAPTSQTGQPGLIHVYNPTPSEFYSFGRWLWVTYNDPDIRKIFNNPFDGVISAHELYATPYRGAKQAIRSGFLTSDTDAYVVPVRYTTINCGDVFIPEFYNNYLDYAPYTKCSVYLPFIGFVELDANDVINHGINITYKVDSYSGACIAQITSYRDGYSNTIYQFSGSCSSEIPLAGGSQSAIRAAMLSSAAYGITGLISSGAASLPSSISSAVNNLSYATSKVAHSGTFGGSYGAMGVKRPYIVIKRQHQVVVVNYNTDYGFPAHKRVIIGACTGYLRVREVNVVSATATDDEKQEIESLLKAGVYVS